MCPSCPTRLTRTSPCTRLRSVHILPGTPSPRYPQSPCAPLPRRPALMHKNPSALAIFHYFLYYRNRKEKKAIKACGALAQEPRLKVCGLLVRHAPHGLPAGSIAAQVGVPASTMSTHLAQLER